MDACVQKTVDDRRERYSKNISERANLFASAEYESLDINKTSEDRYRRKSDTYNKQHHDREIIWEPTQKNNPTAAYNAIYADG